MSWTGLFANAAPRGCPKTKYMKDLASIYCAKNKFDHNMLMPDIKKAEFSDSLLRRDGLRVAMDYASQWTTRRDGLRVVMDYIYSAFRKTEGCVYSVIAPFPKKFLP